MSSLGLRLTNVYGEVIRQPVLVKLVNRQSGNVKHAQLPTGLATIDQLTGGIYQVTVEALAYRPVAAFVQLPVDQHKQLEMVCPLAVDKIARLELPRYADLGFELQQTLEGSTSVLGFEGQQGIKLYESLDELRTATLLNIAVKCTATTFTSGRHVWSYVMRLRELRQDRCFADVNPELLSEVRNAVGHKLFYEAPFLLHTPPVGYEHAGSFKTYDQYGNLQVTFFKRGECTAVDMDIDDASGLEHVFHVLQHHALQQDTHPYDIHQILLQHQQLDTQYRLVTA